VRACCTPPHQSLIPPSSPRQVNDLYLLFWFSLLIFPSSFFMFFYGKVLLPFPSLNHQ
jgi:hypothetical protein